MGLEIVKSPCNLTLKKKEFHKKSDHPKEIPDQQTGNPKLITHVTPRRTDVYPPASMNRSRFGSI